MAVAWDSLEGADRIRSYFEQNRYPWDAYLGNRDLFESYRVTSQSTKIGLDRNGIIIFRKGYGSNPADWWEERLSELARGSSG